MPSAVRIKYQDTGTLCILGGAGLGTPDDVNCTDGYNPNAIQIKITCAIIYCATRYDIPLIKKKVGKVYILCIPTDPGHWTCPIGVRDSIRYWLDSWGISYTIIDNYTTWYNLSIASPEYDILVINTHGEGVPVPPDYGWVYDAVNGWNSNYKTVCYNFYTDLLTTIKNYRWLYIEPIGYPWYNAFQNGQCTHLGPNGALGSQSISNSCKTVLGYNINCFGNRTYYPDLTLKQMFQKVYNETISSFTMPRGYKLYTTDYECINHVLARDYLNYYHIGLFTPIKTLMNVRYKVR